MQPAEEEEGGGQPGRGGGIAHRGLGRGRRRGQLDFWVLAELEIRTLT